MKSYPNNVFINCPFDEDFAPLLGAIIFTIFDAGFYPRCALELVDSATPRIERITSMIKECRYGVHDLSRTETNQNGLPRFNMPFELGLFLGCKAFSEEARQKQKHCLITTDHDYTYQQYLSDIAGQDPKAHRNNPAQVIVILRNWLASASQRENIPGGNYIAQRYQQFQQELPRLAEILMLDMRDLQAIEHYYDTTKVINLWLQENSLPHHP